LNYVVNAGGSLIVEALNDIGDVIGKSKGLTGEAVDAPTVWEKKPDLAAGIIQLRFIFKNADVYSMRFE
jgi:hypothetical protein